MYFEVGGEHFSFTGKQLLDPGYTGVMTWQAITSDERVPDLKKEQQCPVQDVRELNVFIDHTYRYKPENKIF